ncbi:MAG: hypothetical protein ACXVBX_16345, partial [Flavisolibacter sp.]
SWANERVEKTVLFASCFAGESFIIQPSALRETRMTRIGEINTDILNSKSVYILSIPFVRVRSSNSALKKPQL